MLNITIYSIVLGSSFILLTIVRLSVLIIRFFASRLGGLLARHVLYPIVLRRTRITPALRRSYVLCSLLYWSGTCIINFFGQRLVGALASKAGHLALINMIPLFFSGRLALVADLTGLSLRTWKFVHGSLGLMVIVQSLLHFGLLASRTRMALSNHQHLSGIVGGASLLLMVVLIVFRSSYYEFVSKLHFVLAIVTIIATWKHLEPKVNEYKVYFYVAGSLFSFTAILQYGRILWLNLRSRSRSTKMWVKRIDDLLVVDLKVPRGWQVKAGDFIYLYVPGVSLLAFLQSHPFMVAWWNHSDMSSDQLTLLVKVETGITKRLADCSSQSQLHAFIDGPYGQRYQYGEYGTVLLLATGIGIAAQIGHVKQLLEEYQNGKIRTRHIILVWQLDAENQENWVQSWMQELLDKDTDHMLRIRLYVTEDFKDGQAEYGVTKNYSKHDRLIKLYGNVDLPALFVGDVQKSRGDLLISVAAVDKFRDEVWQLTRQYPDIKIKLLDAAFQVPSRNGFWFSRDRSSIPKGVV